MNKTGAQACRLREVAPDRRFTHSVGEEALTSLWLKLAAPSGPCVGLCNAHATSLSGNDREWRLFRNIVLRTLKQRRRLSKSYFGSDELLHMIASVNTLSCCRVDI